MLKKPKVSSLNCFFCSTNSLQLKKSSFTVIKDKEKRQILIFKKQEPESVWYFCLKNDRNYYQSFSLLKLKGYSTNLVLHY